MFKPQLHPDIDLSKTPLSASQHFPTSLSAKAGSDARAELQMGGSSNEESSDEDPAEPLVEWVDKLQIDPLYPRQVIGSWSGKKLVNSALDLKNQAMGPTGPPIIHRRVGFWGPKPVCLYHVA
jgi:hypothetical protein